MTVTELIAAWLYLIAATVEARFHELNMLKCPKCGCRHRVSVNNQYVDAQYGPVCEFDDACAECGYIMNYWGYGSFAFPTTYTELIALRWFMIKSNVKHFFHWRVVK